MQRRSIASQTTPRLAETRRVDGRTTKLAQVQEASQLPRSFPTVFYTNSREYSIYSETANASREDLSEHELDKLPLVEQASVSDTRQSLTQVCFSLLLRHLDDQLAGRLATRCGR